MKQWKKNNDVLCDILNGSCNPENFDEMEKQFYHVQVFLARRMVLSNEIDHEHEKVISEKEEKCREEIIREQMEQSFNV